jgi:hypothetical protein
MRLNWRIYKDGRLRLSAQLVSTALFCKMASTCSGFRFALLGQDQTVVVRDVLTLHTARSWQTAPQGCLASSERIPVATDQCGVPFVRKIDTPRAVGPCHFSRRSSSLTDNFLSFCCILALLLTFSTSFHQCPAIIHTNLQACARVPQFPLD